MVFHCSPVSPVFEKWLKFHKLLEALNQLRKFKDYSFSITAIHLDLGFNELTNLEIKAISGNKNETSAVETNEAVDANSVETTGNVAATTENATEGTSTEESTQQFDVQE